MKKFLPLILLVVVVAGIVVLKKGGPAEDVEPVVWYGMMPHPYMTEVQVGVKAASEELGMPILISMGQEWTQDNENQNVESLSTKGHKAFSIYPGDPAGANGLFKMLVDKGQIVVAYGAEPNLPTPASFTVATDIRQAATDACEELVKMMVDKKLMFTEKNMYLSLAAPVKQMSKIEI